MRPVRRVQTVRDATERRALATELPVETCMERLEAATWIETGENAAIDWPLPPGKTVFGWISSEGFMLSPAREHERLSLDLAWGGWSAQEGLSLVAVDLISLKTSRPLLLLLPVVGLVGYLGFSLLAGQLLLSPLETLVIGALVAGVVIAISIVDERRSQAAHRQLFQFLLTSLDAVEIPRRDLPPDGPLLPPAPERSEPPGPVAWRR
jgi:hypothetical protein